jgi:hypothetical protein
MCLKCDSKPALLRQLSAPSARPGWQGEGNAGTSRPVRHLCLDPVRAMRLRELLERTLLAGLGPQLLAHVPPHRRILPPPTPGRGGAQQVFVRQLAIYLGHVGCRLNYSQAGSLYARDRTTAAHACAVIEDRRDDPRLDHTLALLELCVRAEFRRIDPRWADRVLSHEPRPSMAARVRAETA